MPEFPKPIPDFTQEQALTMILSSIALEEVALSHIINAEGEKIQYILSQTGGGECSCDTRDILKVNKSVSDLLEIVLQNQMILKNKMESVLEFLPRPPRPPDPPIPPCPPPKPPCPPPTPPCPPPKPPCPPPCDSDECTCCERPAYFGVITGTYPCGNSLEWEEISTGGHFKVASCDRTRIIIPHSGTFIVDLSLDVIGCRNTPVEVMLLISSEDKPAREKTLRMDSCGCKAMVEKRTVIQMPCSCCPSYASVIICTPGGLHIRGGEIVFSRL